MILVRRTTPYLIVALLALQSSLATEEASGDLTPLFENIGTTQIFFPKSSDYMRLVERRKLDTIAQLLQSSPGETLIIAGKTDPHGDKDFNEWLRSERSGAVFDYLLSAGVPEDRLTLAESDLKSSDPPSGESASQMRRVEFSIAGRQQEIAKAVAKRGDQIPQTEEAAAKPAEFDPAKNFRQLRSRDYELNHMRETAGATKIYFEYTSTSVRTEYWRDLKRLAHSLQVTLDAAVAITGYASPNLPPEEATRLAKTRAMSAAAKLNALGVDWDRMLIVREPGKTTHPAPHWRNHRVEFSPRVLIEPIEKQEPKFVAASDPSPRSRSAGSDSLTNLAKQATIYFGSKSSLLKPRDRRALQEIARLLTMPGENRSLTIRAFADSSQDLSERRQNAVLDTLAEFSAPISRLFIELVPPSADSAWQPTWKQRRVELILN